MLASHRKNKLRSYIDIAVQHGLKVLWWNLWHLVNKIHQEAPDSVVSSHFARLSKRKTHFSISGTQSLWPRKRNNKEKTQMHKLTSDFFPGWQKAGLTSTSSAYCSTMVRVSWILAEADPTCCKSLDKPITLLGLKQVFMIRSTESKGRISEKNRLPQIPV